MGKYVELVDVVKIIYVVMWKTRKIRVGESKYIYMW